MSSSALPTHTAADEVGRDANDHMPALTGIRFPLALWVVLHHISGPGRMLEPLAAISQTLNGLIDAAWVALTAFFAISGFVLARRYRATRWDRPTLGRYAAARFGRIYPVYLISLVILLPIIYDAMGRQETGSPAVRAGLVLNYVLLLQGWQWPSVNWNTPAWSLSCEVFFYACAPLIVPLVRVASWARALAVVVLACALPIGIRFLMDAPIPKALLYSGDFLIGVAAAGLYDCLRSRGTSLRRLGPWLYTPALAGGLALLLWRDALGPFLVFDTGVRLASALLVLGLACGGGRMIRALSSPAAQAGGHASYAIYILHIPVLWWFERWRFDTVLSAYAPLAYLGAVIALALAVSRWYEGPANALVRAWGGLARPTPRLATRPAMLPSEN